MDTRRVIDGYLSQGDWRVKENANTSYSFSGLSLRVSEDAFEEYAMDYIIPPAIKEAHKNCYIKIHDVGYLSPYCLGHDLKKLLDEGLNGVANKISTTPPNHFNSAINIIVNYFGILQMESAGAQAFSNFDTLLAPFVKADGLDYKQTKQGVQNFIYHMNISNRWGCQAIFSNITLDIKCANMFASTKPLIGGKQQSYTYGDCQEQMDMINQALFEIMIGGDATGAPFTFPIITINLTKDFDWESNISKLVFQATSKYGLPYFQNFINSDLDPEDVYAMCCRLQIDKRELKKHTGGLFGAGASTGSLRVITLNLPKLAYESKGSVGRFYELIKKYSGLAKEAHEIYRGFLNKQLNNGLYPYIKRYVGTFDNHFNTIGIVGGNEACLNLLGKSIAEPEGKRLMVNTLAYLRELIADYQEETGHLYNLEATPAESTSHKLALFDKQQYPEIKTAGTEEAPYYTNSTLLPVDDCKDIIETIEHQDDLQTLYNSGTVLHFYMGEEIKNWKTCMNLVKRIANNAKMPYFSITTTYSVCPICGYVSGVHAYCPHQHKESDVDKWKRRVCPNE